MSKTVLLNDDSEKISCVSVKDILFVLCLFNADLSCQAYNFGHREEKLLLHLSILSCFNSNKVVKQFLFNSSYPHSKCFFVVIQGYKRLSPSFSFKQKLS